MGSLGYRDPPGPFLGPRPLGTPPSIPLGSVVFSIMDLMRLSISNDINGLAVIRFMAVAVCRLGDSESLSMLDHWTRPWAVLYGL